MKYRKLDNPVKIHKTKMLRNFQIEKLENSILPNKTSFFLYISGAASSGKTTCIMSLLNNDYSKVFDKIMIYSPSAHSIGNKLKLPEDRFKKDLSTLAQDYKEIREEYKEALQDNIVINTLIVIDDLVGSIKKSDAIMKALVYNRAHANISLIITSQKYRVLPLEFRCNASHIIAFPTKNSKELEAIAEESELFYNKKGFIRALIDMFNEKFCFVYLDLVNSKCYKKFDYELVEDEKEKYNIEYDCSDNEL